MIRSLRKRAFWMTQVLCVCAIFGLYAGLAWRKQIPIRPRMTDMLQERAPGGRQVWQQDTGGEPALAAAVWLAEDRVALTLEFAQQPLFADALVYWQADGAGDETRRLLGPLAAGRSSVFSLPQDVGQGDGRIVLFSLAHGAELRAFPLPKQDLGTLPAPQEDPR